MKKVHCAIYTRKSSEEGLEQDFNSLHAQREACAAYTLSQASEGWTLLDAEYDDGGLSGGTLERPALQRLLADIKDGKIDTVVVYKVDRLTRSLLDFAKLVETMDKAEVSFVSVTQSFNTTTSMGRLTLNMLLSFAQFEREVTAERIRDKIAASKAKGMWMGGTPPLGYEPDGRTLKVIDEHANVIRSIFERYLKIGNVRLMMQDFVDEKVMAPSRTLSTGRAIGGGHFTRGQIYKILSNPIYVGDIPHKELTYKGNHNAIIDREMFERVQAKLADNTQGKQRAAKVKSPSILAGLVFDEDGKPLVSNHACKGKTRYRYYVSRDLQKGEAADGWRIPAKELEAAVIQRLTLALDEPLDLVSQLNITIEAAALKSATQNAGRTVAKLRKKHQWTIKSLIKLVRVFPDRIDIQIDSKTLSDLLDLKKAKDAPDDVVISVDARLTRSGQAMKTIQPSGKSATEDVDQSLIDLLVKAREWWARLSDGKVNIATLAREEGITASWITRVVRLNFLSPQIIDAILAGKQPATLVPKRLTNAGQLPYRWDDQASSLLR
ncbi:MAG: recombinase family protein [Marinomonas sp.]|uniref:recombinase family protein n=1 Tax=Parasphingorhabdus sp. TaxID=2709688 RepID=UPI00327ECDB4